jgi:hypothetical protein
MASVENNHYAAGNFPQINTEVEIHITFDICKHYHWNLALQFVSMSIPYTWFQFTWGAVRGVNRESQRVVRVCMFHMSRGARIDNMK